MLENRRQRPHRRLVAGNHGDGALQTAGAQVLAHRVMGDLAANQRIAHLAGAVAHPVRGRDGIFRLHQAHAHLVGRVANILAQALMDRLDLPLYPEIALGIALVANHPDRGLMNEIDVGAKFSRDANRLRIAPGIIVKKNRSGISHH